MTIAPYAVIDAGNVVQNIVAWDGDATTWQPPAGSTTVNVSGLACVGGQPIGIGCTHAGGNPGTFTFAQTSQQIIDGNRASILAFTAAAIPVLATMGTQLQTLRTGTFVDYGTANLANLNDLKHKVQAIAGGPSLDGAGGLEQVVTGLSRLCRLLSNTLDATT